PTLPPENLFTQTQIYLIALETGGSVGCGDSTIPFTIDIEPTVAPLTAALNQLFSIGEQPFGYYNALGNLSLSVRGIDIDEGNAEIDLVGSFSTAGVCDAPRIEAQIRQTALQYFTIDSVTILVNGQPLENYFSGQ
ncbi:MAG: GerMN domain-containing protein, partial [Anaerolineae bacterium]